MSKEKQILYMVVKNLSDNSDNLEQLDMLINENDDKNGKVVGVKDGSVELVPVREADWRKDKDKMDGKTIFVGDIKDAEHGKAKVTYVFEKYGVKYGWSDAKHAFIDVDEKVLSDQATYYDFLSEFSRLPVCNEKLKDGWEDGLHPGKLKDRKAGLHPIQTFVVPFGFVKTIKDNHDDKEMVRKQLYTYGVIMFYYNHLQKFMDLK